MSPSEPVPAEVLALAVSIAIERRRLATAASTLAAAAGGLVDEDPADVCWRWGSEVGGWT